jgi:hypothetical protein
MNRTMILVTNIEVTVPKLALPELLSEYGMSTLMLSAGIIAGLALSLVQPCGDVSPVDRHGCPSVNGHKALPVSCLPVSI